jgi:multisubunit Na+/H+ antiporter MnhC subunit
MNSKQLANVLIKILGLSLIAHGIPSLINGILFTSDIRHSSFSAIWMIAILDLIPFAVGIFLIVRSRWITEILFKNEAE